MSPVCLDYVPVCFETPAFPAWYIFLLQMMCLDHFSRVNTQQMGSSKKNCALEPCFVVRGVRMYMSGLKQMPGAKLVKSIMEKIILKVLR
eukprot:5177081-Amphidinium_carterae.1